MLIYLSFLLVIFSGYLIYRLIKTKKNLTKREELQKQKVYQITILKEIQDKIGYSLDTEEVVDVITGSLSNLFRYSASSSLLLKGDKLLFKVHLEEEVNRQFIEEVKKSTIASLSALYGMLPTQIIEHVSGAVIDDSKVKKLASFFHIPLIISGKVVGIITVSSTTANIYKDEEMTILYQITSEASTALTRLNSVLETEKGKLTSMISGLADGVFMVDVKKQLMIINKAAKSFLGVGKEVLSFSDILSAFKGQYDLSEKIDQAVSSTGYITDKEVAIGEKFFDIYITPVFAPFETSSKEIIGVSVLLHDITVEKQIDTIKQDFTYMMVHEIRAPLTGIRASSELLLQGLNKEDERQMLKIIDQQSKSLLDQIGSLLDASKIEAKKFTVQKTQGDIKSVINGVVEILRSVATKKGISILIDLPDKLPVVSFDPTRISQVMNNLISNSLKFTNQGGKIVISAKITNGFLDISVTDNGIGVSKENQKDLFSKYFQIRTTPHQLAKKGTGLGLYIVKGVVEAHGGTVWVESPARNASSIADAGGEQGKGTTITFSLPIPIPNHYQYHNIEPLQDERLLHQPILQGPTL